MSTNELARNAERFTPAPLLSWTSMLTFHCCLEKLLFNHQRRLCVYGGVHRSQRRIQCAFTGAPAKHSGGLCLLTSVWAFNCTCTFVHNMKALRLSKCSRGHPSYGKNSRSSSSNYTPVKFCCDLLPQPAHRAKLAQHTLVHCRRASTGKLAI